MMPMSVIPRGARRAARQRRSRGGHTREERTVAKGETVPPTPRAWEKYRIAVRTRNKSGITVEESKTTETQLEVGEGLQFDRGYLSPCFISDPEKMEAMLEDALILLTDRKISVMKDLLPILEQVSRAGAGILIVTWRARRWRRSWSTRFAGRSSASQ